MAKARVFLKGILLLQAIAISFAAPNGTPTAPQQALEILQAKTATATSDPVIAQAYMDHENDLKKRAGDPVSLPSSSSTLTIHNTFTNLASSGLSLPGGPQNVTTSPATTSSGPAVMETGMFTGADGGQYQVTSESGYVAVDGKTLYPGQTALIGNEDVWLASHGFVANGQTLALSTITMTTAVAATTTEASNTMASSSGSSGGSSSASAAASSSSVSTSSSGAAAGAMPTQQAGNAVLAAVGGLVGLMML